MLNGERFSSLTSHPQLFTLQTTFAHSYKCNWCFNIYHNVHTLTQSHNPHWPQYNIKMHVASVSCPTRLLTYRWESRRTSSMAFFTVVQLVSFTDPFLFFFFFKKYLIYEFSTYKTGQQTHCGTIRKAQHCICVREQTCTDRKKKGKPCSKTLHTLTYKTYQTLCIKIKYIKLHWQRGTWAKHNDSC